MANVIRPLAAEIASPTSAGAASNVSGAQIVRAVNTAAGGTQYLVTLQQADSDSTIIGSFSLAGNDTTFKKKNTTEEEETLIRVPLSSLVTICALKQAKCLENFSTKYIAKNLHSQLLKCC